MTTRFALFCDKLLEAGWLAALVVAPLFFDVYSSRVFEPDKISLVRSLALVMIAAWVVRQIEIGLPKQPVKDLLRSVWRDNPLLLPTVVTIVVYIISTIFSIAPAVSFWGSYQRMQGTYTTFSYIVIFFVAATTLRTRAQLDRAVSTMIVVSFPIAFYGLLQHYQLDPLPWGGDVTIRVASNMGNSIFVAAFLIMVIPLTIARWIETLARSARAAGTRAAPVALAAFALVALMVLATLDFVLGVALMFALFLFVLVFAALTRTSWRDGLLVAAYTIVLATQIVAVIFTQSRGPWLGLAAGLFVFVVLFALARGARRVVLGMIGLAMVGAAFLFVLNLPISTPLDPIKQVPYVGRLGQILETEGGTGKVRELIWQGAVKMIVPHDPVWSPVNGNDPLNALRPLIGYGPEAMYVAFNPFYPPDLAHYEARNASPDRSHNETFDSLVMTGLLGFGAYILLFTSLFYFGLKWLQIIRTRGERNIFLLLWLASGFIVALVFGFWRGWNFVGVALPFGMIGGLMIFFIGSVLRRSPGPSLADAESNGSSLRALWLPALFAALIGHFIEINFGIAIVSTRTYFWFYAALLVVIGLNRLQAAREVQPMAPVLETTPVDKARTMRRRRRAAENPHPAARRENEDVSIAPVLAWTAIISLIVITLAYEFINNQGGAPSALEAVWHSLFYKGSDVSLGVFLMFLFTWVIAGVIGLGEELRGGRIPSRVLTISTALFVIVSFTMFVWYILFQMRWLTQPGDLTNGFIAVLGLFYIAFLVLVVGTAVALTYDVLPRPRMTLRGALNAAVVPVLSLAVIAAIYLSNYTNVSADILYKSAGNSDNAGTFDQSVSIYQQAVTLQPTQDFYQLFLGRAYLESARNATDVATRTQFLNKAEQTLLQAQRLNPLNTDHTANLARLHRIWASLATDPTDKTAHNQKSSEYYADATRLSPYTAYLYNEWSQTYVQGGDWENARAKLEQSLQIDPIFGQTYYYLGEYYRARPNPDLGQAADNYLKAISFDPSALSEVDGTPMSSPIAVLARPEYLTRTLDAYRAISTTNPTSLQPHFAMAELYKRSGQMDKARQELEQARRIAPTDYTVQLVLVNFYSESGQIDSAVAAMRVLMDMLSSRTPDYQRFADFYTQLQNLQKAIQAAKNAPNDVNAHRTLAAMWKARLQPQFAVPEYQIVVRLMPNDYDANKNIALLSLQLNQLDDAQRALTTAAALAPDADKSFWQNVQAALNAHKAQQYDQAIKSAQAASSLASDADRAAVQAYITMLQDKVK